MKKLSLIFVAFVTVLGLSSCTTPPVVEKDTTNIDTATTVKELEDSSPSVSYADAYSIDPLGFSITLTEENPEAVQDIADKACSLALPEETLLQFQMEENVGFLEVPVCFEHSTEFASKFFAYPGNDNQVSVLKTESEPYTVSITSGNETKIEEHKKLIQWVSTLLGAENVNFINRIKIGDKSSFDFVSKNTEEANKQIATANIILEKIAPTIDASYVDVEDTLYVTVSASTTMPTAEAKDVFISILGDKYSNPIVVN